MKNLVSYTNPRPKMTFIPLSLEKMVELDKNNSITPLKDTNTYTNVFPDPKKIMSIKNKLGDETLKYNKWTKTKLDFYKDMTYNDLLEYVRNVI